MLTLSALVAAMAVTEAQAQDGQATLPPREPCVEARSEIRIDASDEPVARNVVAITYRVTNRGDEPLTWVRIGAGGGAAMAVPTPEAPVIFRSAAGWTGRVDPAEGSRVGSFVWESVPGTALRAGESFEVVVRGRDRRYLRIGQTDASGRPLMPIDFGLLPFSAGSASRCWWGRTHSTWELPDGGYWAAVLGVTIRPFRQDGTQYVIVDAPMREWMMRLSDRRIFLTTSLGVSWGTAGGFSADTTIGIGLNWSPSKYVSVSAQTRFGTFFFNNRTHLRSVSADVNIPIQRPPFTESMQYQRKCLVVGVEYFQRDVVRWKGYLDGPQWYASGHGVALRVGIREIGWAR
jgi:hypothetical protein